MPLPKERILFFQVIPRLVLGAWYFIQSRVRWGKNVAVEYNFFRLESFVFPQAAKLFDCSKAVIVGHPLMV